MLSPNTLYREQSIQLERERLRYMRCNTIIDILLLISMIIMVIGVGIYFVFIIVQGKSITIS